MGPGGVLAETQATAAKQRGRCGRLGRPGGPNPQAGGGAKARGPALRHKNRRGVVRCHATANARRICRDETVRCRPGRGPTADCEGRERLENRERGTSRRGALVRGWVRDGNPEELRDKPKRRFAAQDSLLRINGAFCQVLPAWTTVRLIPAGGLYPTVPASASGG